MSAQRGFTLIEALVALAVFALLASSGVLVLRQSLDNQQAVQQRIDSVARLQRLDNLLRADLGQATRRSVRQVDGQAATAVFTGATDGDAAAWSGRSALFAFTRGGWDNPAQPRPQLLHVQYRLQGQALVRLSRDRLDGSSHWQQQVLLDEVQQLQLAYHDGSGWNRGWPGGLDQLPRALRLRYHHRDFGMVEHVLALPAEGR